MHILTAIITSALGFSAVSLGLTEPETSREIRIERHVEVDSDAAAPLLQKLLEHLGGTIEIDVEVHSDSDDIDFDGSNLEALLSGIGGAEGSIKAVIIGPDGRKRVIERELGDLGDLLAHVRDGRREGQRHVDDNIDIRVFLGDRMGDADMDMDPEIREHVMEMMRQGFHMPEGMNPLDAHRRNDGHGEGHGDMDMARRMEQLHPEDAHRMHTEMIERMQGDRRQESDRPRHERGDRGDGVEHLMHELDASHMEIRELHEALEEMHRHIEHMEHGEQDGHDEHGDDRGRDDEGAERFMHAAESFMEQLQYAKAVGSQLADDTGVAMLGIWYASESMEPGPCLELMVSLMNDDAIARNVRRAAGFVAIEKARQVGNHGASQRILGAIIRGAGTTAPGPRLHQQTDRVTDRAPQRDRPRDTDAKRKSQRDKKKGDG